MLKNLLILLILLFPAAISAQSNFEPSANALLFEVTDTDGVKYDAYLDLRQVPQFSPFLEVRYRRAGETSSAWTFLTGPDVMEFNLSTAESTDAEFVRLLGLINIALHERFGVSDVPIAGIERLLWLIKNTDFSNGQLIGPV